MKIDTTALHQLKAFNDFARNFSYNKDAVATLGTANADGTVSSIEQNMNDKSRAFTRTDENKGLNNRTRELFFETIAKLFGGEDNIPSDVLKAMHIKRFGGDGRPLTARRINAVNIAVIKSLRTREADGVSDLNGNKLSADSVAAALDGERTQTNTNILNCLDEYDNEEAIESLPDDIQGALSAIKETINTRCGAGTVKSLGGVVEIVGNTPLMMRLQPLTTGLIRDLNRNDIVSAINSILKTDSTLEQFKLMERMEELSKNAVPGANVNKQVAYAMFESIPGLLDELKTCKRPDDFKRTLDKFEPQIKTRMEIGVKMLECEQTAVDTLLAEFKKITGLDPKKLNPPLNTNAYRFYDVERLKADIRTGKVSITRADDVQSAFVNYARNYINARMELGQKIEEEFKMLPYDWSRTHLRQFALTVPKIKQLAIGGANYLKDIDLQPLKDAISAKPYDRDAVKIKTYDFLRKILDIAKDVLGKAIGKDLANWGIEDLSPFMQLMIKAALAKDPELVKAIMPHIDEIQDDVMKHINGLPREQEYDKQTIAPASSFSLAVLPLYAAMPQELK